MQERGGETRKAQRTRTVALDALPTLPGSPEECEEALRWTVAAIATGQLDAVTGRAVSDTLRTLHTAMVNRLGLEKRAKDLQRKLDALAKGKTDAD